MNNTKLQNEKEEEQFSFKPYITERAKSKPSKTIDQLCKGDQEKIAQRIKQQREEAEIKLKQETTFKPSIARSTGILNYSPQSHKERLETRNQNTKKKLEEMEKEKDQREMAECSFKPVIHKSPEYIKKIANSMSLLRQQQQAETKYAKPQWK